MVLWLYFKTESLKIVIIEDLKLKTVKGANDYESMREILTRRFNHGLEEVKKIKEIKSP